MVLKFRFGTFTDVTKYTKANYEPTKYLGIINTSNSLEKKLTP